MTVSKREALIAKTAIAVAWLLFALSIGIGLHAGVSAAQQARGEPDQMEAMHQP